jgi:phosphate:Na+ symporter
MLGANVGTALLTQALSFNMVVEAMLQDALEVIRRDDRGRASTVAQWSRCIEQLGTAIRRYLADVGDEQTLDDQFLDCTAN